MSGWERVQKGVAISAPIVAVAGSAAFMQPSVAGSDLWWHLASGREILTSGGIPGGDPFSYTARGALWMNHEWLWDVVYWSAYRLHPDAAAWLNLAVVIGILALFFAVARRASGSALASGAALWLAAAASHWFIDIRPHLFTLLLVGVVLATRRHRWAPWLWPPLMVVWANLHGGFVFGLGVMGLSAVVLTLELTWADANREGWRPRRLVVPWRHWAGVVGAMVAMFLNPWGWRILEYPLAYLDPETKFRSLIEWRSPAFAFDPAGYELRFWTIALVAALGVPLAAARQRFALALGLVTFAMAWTSRRFIPLFALTAAPVVALALAWALRRLVERLRILQTAPAALAVLIAAALLASLFWRDVRLVPRPLHRWTQSFFYPEAGLRYLRALDVERVLNLYNWGGYIALHAPEIPVFIDGRANTVYGERIYADYLTLAAADAGYAALVERYRIDAVFFPASARLLRSLSTEHGWRVIYTDDVSAIAVPPDSPVLRSGFPSAKSVVGDHPNLLVARARAAALRGDLIGATDLIEEALRQDPLLVQAYGALARVKALGNDPDGIEAAIERGIAAIPRASRRLREFEGYAFEMAGDYERAVEALRRARPGGPFRNPARFDAYLARLEKRASAQ